MTCPYQTVCEQDGQNLDGYKCKGKVSSWVGVIHSNLRWALCYFKCLQLTKKIRVTHDDILANHEVHIFAE